jgi:hypothetical protein
MPDQPRPATCPMTMTICGPMRTWLMLALVVGGCGLPMKKVEADPEYCGPGKLTCSCERREINSLCVNYPKEILLGTVEQTCPAPMIFSKVVACPENNGTGKCREFPGTLVESEEVFYSDGATPYDTYCAQKKCTEATGNYTAIASVPPEQIIRASCNVPSGGYCEDFIGIYWGSMSTMASFCTTAGGTLSATTRCAPGLGTCRKKPCTNQDELFRVYNLNAANATTCASEGGIWQ